MYDWANSVYSLSIATAVFPIYYKSVTIETVHFIGRNFNNNALYAYAISVSFMIVALISPMLAPIADFRGSKLSFMKFFCYLGSISCCALYFFTGENITWGMSFLVVASVGFAGSIVYYNAYLKEIVNESDQDRVSAKGFILGYIGSVILLIFNLLMVLKPEWFGIANTGGQAARISFITVGIWWAAFAQIPFAALKRFKHVGSANDVISEKEKVTIGTLFGGYSELKKVWNEVRNIKSLRNYLFSFFFFNSGVQTVMYMAPIFGSEVVFKNDPDGQFKLITCVLIIQLVAIIGAMIFSKISKQYGNVISISITIFIWLGVCIAAYVLRTEAQFYAIAFCVGMVMGGIQSIARSTYSKLIPPTKDTASFFSFYDATEKIATVFGTAVYGLVTEMTGNMRNTVLFLFVFFVIGLILLISIRKEKSLLPV